MIINKPSEMSEKEAKIYVDYLEGKYQRKVAELTIDLDAEDEEYVGLTYSLEDIPFERIRRITGYLVGTMDHWNDAKSAEERDRVKHGISGAQATEVL